MATTNVAVTQLTRAGVSCLAAGWTAAASGDGNSFYNTGNEIVILDNAGAATDVVATFVTPGTVDGLAIANQTYALAANDRLIVKPFPPSIYNATGATDTNKVTVTWAGTLTNAKMGVYAL